MWLLGITWMMLQTAVIRGAMFPLISLIHFPQVVAAAFMAALTLVLAVSNCPPIIASRPASRTPGTLE